MLTFLYVELRATLRRNHINFKMSSTQWLISRPPAMWFLGRPSLNTFGVVVLTLYKALKFLIFATKVKVMHADQKEALKVYYHECLE